VKIMVVEYVADSCMMNRMLSYVDYDAIINFTRTVYKSGSNDRAIALCAGKT
jgi:hypothetical protein